MSGQTARGFGLAGSLVSGLLVLSACATSSSGTTGDVNSESAKAFSAAVDGYLTEATQAQQTMPPADGPAAVSGKRIAIVSVTLAEEGAKRNIAGLEAAADALGWDYEIYDGQGVPTTANAKIEQAVTTKPDAIVLVGLDAALVQGGLKAANDAGIPVACNTCWDASAPDSTGQFVSVAPPLKNFEEMGYATAAYAYREAEGAPRFITMNDASLTNLSAREEGFDRFIDECGAANAPCEVVADAPFLLAEMTTQLPIKAASAARAHPEFNALWVSFDFAAQQAINGLTQAGLAKAPVFAVSSNGDAANLEQIGDGGFQKVTVGIAFEWAGYANLDNLNRLFAGEQPVQQEMPIRLFDETNIDAAEGGAWQADVDFAAAYETIWND